MKYMKSFILAALLIFVAWEMLFALADVKNKATTSYFEDDQQIVWYGKVAFSTGDSTNDIWTKALWIGDCDLTAQEGTLQIWGNAASGADVNVFIEGSNSLYDASFLAHRVDTVLDAVGSATVKITLVGSSYIATTKNTPVKDHATRCEYLRLQFDGQAGNPSTAVIYFTLRIPKRNDVKTTAGSAVYPGNRLQSTTATLPTYGKSGSLNQGRQ